MLHDAWHIYWCYIRKFGYDYWSEQLIWSIQGMSEPKWADEFSLIWFWDNEFLNTTETTYCMKRDMWIWLKILDLRYETWSEQLFHDTRKLQECSLRARMCFYACKWQLYAQKRKQSKTLDAKFRTQGFRWLNSFCWTRHPPQTEGKLLNSRGIFLMSKWSVKFFEIRLQSCVWPGSRLVKKTRNCPLHQNYLKR